MLKGKTIVLAVSGSIAAYKIANLASMLKKLNANVQVIMTENATNFINPITFETLTGRKCLVDTFDRNFQYNVEHIAVAKKADVVLVAPASANVIGKLANGIADDMLTTTVMACTCRIIIAPAMNTNMFLNPIVKDNIKKLKQFGMEVIDPASGHLACGDYGMGKMPDEEILLQYILYETAFLKDLTGRKVLVTAGATRERIDPVRFITNYSTGKMGFALARGCMLRGAEVTLIKGKTEAAEPMFVKVLAVNDAAGMFTAVKECYEQQDIIIKAAAVSDYTPVEYFDHKIKKSEKDLSIELKRTMDILAFLGEHKRKDQFLCGFSMETQNVIENSKEKFEKKKLDMIVSNNVKEEGAGFGVDTNIVTVITKDRVEKLPIMNKDEVAKAIIDRIALSSQYVLDQL
jgi:phosphopantothenoylcysteine decarboxylase/phosphopantothenate--cysteine ligase